MDEGAPAARTQDREVGQAAMTWGTIAAVICTFVFRFLTIEFTNDHFVHVTRGWHILLGEVPIRDFFDPGLFLQYYASAAALLVSGHNLLGEAILTSAFIAAGAGLTFLAAARVSRSFWLASLAATCSTLSMPRLYNYPKIFFYVLAIVGAWRYAQRPGRGSLVMLAVITVTAFLFRYDHGVYIGLAVLTLLVIRHWGDRGRTVRAVGEYMAVALLLVSPFLLFIQATTGLITYVGSLVPQMERVSTPRVNRLPITIDPSAPLFVVSPPIDLRINVRWASDIDPDTRERLERRHRLTKGEHVEDSTWSYVLADENRERITALVNDPAVVDTHGIDRASREMNVQEPLYLRIQRWIPIFRMHLAPGVFTSDNALAWFYYLALLLPFISLAMLAASIWFGTIERTEASVIGVVTVLSIITVQTLVRGSPDSRLADVANPVCVIGAWVSARCLWPHVPRRRSVQRIWTIVVCAAIATTLWSVMSYGSVLANLDVSRILTGPAGMWWRMGVVIERTSARPIDAWEPGAPGVAGLGRYVFECTESTDRVLVAGFAPDLFFYAERRFAGGQVYLRADWHASPADQRLTVDRLTRQRVPVIIERVEETAPIRFPVLYEYLRRYYKDVPIRSDAMTRFRVLVDSRRTPTGTYEPLGLPCYR